jgi:hypothetical protein
MWLKFSYDYPSGILGITKVFGFSKGILIFSVACLLAIGFFPVKLHSQFEPDSKVISESIEVSGLIKGKKTITVQINLTATIIQNKKIKILIEPTYYYFESAELLDSKAIKNLKLKCDLNIPGIKATPSNYGKLSYQGDPLLPLPAGKGYSLDFELAKGEEFSQDLIFNFPFIIHADKKEKISNADFKLSVTETIKESKNLTPEISGADKDVEVHDKKTVSEQKLNAGSGDKTANEKGGGGEEEATDSVSTVPLENLLKESKELYDEVYSINEIKEESEVTPEQIQKFKAKLDKLRGRIDGLYPNYVEVPEAEPLYKKFDVYEDYTNQVLAELNKFIDKNDNSVLSDKDNEIAQSKKQNKTLQIILIVLGTILLGIVLFVLMKFVMKKVKNNFEKKMKRKATLELNKQKFKVTQQKNKLRV